MAVSWDRRTAHVQFTVAYLRVVEWLFMLAAAILGAVQAWPFLDRPSSVDLVSYLDVGDAYAHGRWGQAINGYWNPLYSWILGAVMAALQPSPRFEYAVAKGVDYAIDLATIAVFAWFLRRLREESRRDSRAAAQAIPDWLWVVGGYTLFIWSLIRRIRVTSNSPDMTAALLTYWAIGLLLPRGTCTRASGVRLGLVLALGYFARTASLFVGAAILAASALVPAGPRERRRAGVAAVVLVAAAVPFVAAVSVARHHVTIGDNGKLNHVWLANPGRYIVPGVHWQGGPPGNGTPRHPERIVWESPRAYEFGLPIVGTYAPWLDPSYWEEGLTYHFDWNAEWTSFSDNVRMYFTMSGGWLLVAALIALLAAANLRATARALPSAVLLWVPAIVGLGAYAFSYDLPVRDLVSQPHSRFVATYLVLLLLAIARSVRLRDWQPAWWIAPTARVAALGLAAAAIVTLSVRDVVPFYDDPTPPHWQAAVALSRAGISPGTPIAIVGHEVRHEFWARLAKVRIVAQVPDDDRFWRSTPEARSALLQALARAGARAVVALPPTRSSVPEGWTEAGGYCERDLTAIN